LQKLRSDQEESRCKIFDVEGVSQIQRDGELVKGMTGARVTRTGLLYGRQIGKGVELVAAGLIDDKEAEIDPRRGLIVTGEETEGKRQRERETARRRNAGMIWAFELSSWVAKGGGRYLSAVLLPGRIKRRLGQKCDGGYAQEVVRVVTDSECALERRTYYNANAS
jgi:hypothetical protein